MQLMENFVSFAQLFSLINILWGQHLYSMNWKQILEPKTEVLNSKTYKCYDTQPVQLQLSLCPE